MNIHIDKSLSEPVFRQISAQLEKAIRDGRIRPGEKLMPERDLAAASGVARGTVKRAYEELRAKGLVRVAPGSGCFALKTGPASEEDRKRFAQEAVAALLKKLEDARYTPEEARALFEMAISERDSRQSMIHVATIDCNPESLAVFKEQFSGFKSVRFTMFLIDDIIRYSNPTAIFEDYDIIITTLTHYEQVLGLIHPLQDRIFKVAVSPAQETVIKIVTIPQGAKTGMIVRSNNFKNLMLTRLASMNIDVSKVGCSFENDLPKLDRLFLEMDVLIIPHFLILDNQWLSKQLHYFEARGGTAIDFKYQIEHGSLIYIEQRIQDLLSENSAYCGG